VGYFDGMEEGVLRANIIEAKVNKVAVRCACWAVSAACGGVCQGVTARRACWHAAQHVHA
jgi:hypothetical protein